MDSNIAKTAVAVIGVDTPAPGPALQTNVAPPGGPTKSEIRAQKKREQARARYWSKKGLPVPEIEDARSLNKGPPRPSTAVTPRRAEPKPAADEKESDEAVTIALEKAAAPTKPVPVAKKTVVTLPPPAETKKQAFSTDEYFVGAIALGAAYLLWPK